MDQLSRLGALDEDAREELVQLLRRMAAEARELSALSILPFTSDTLKSRQVICEAAARRLSDCIS